MNKTTKISAIVLASVTLLLPVAFIFAATFETTPDSTLVTPDGSVASIVKGNDGTIYVGGNFTAIGNPAVRLAIVSTTTGALISSSTLQADGQVALMISDGAGGWYLGGEFHSINGVTRHRLAQIDANGTLTTFNPNITTNTSPAVTSLTLSTSTQTLYVGGNFNTVNGNVTRNGIAAFDTATGAARSWDPDLNGAVYGSILSPDGSTLYIIGSFSMVNQTAGPVFRQNIASVNTTTGSSTSWYPTLSGYPFAGALSPDGSTFYVGEGYPAVNLLEAFDAVTASTTSWNPNIGGSSVDSVIVSPDGSTVYANGQFSTVNGGVARNGVAAFNTVTASTTSWNPNIVGGGEGGMVSRLALSGSKVYAVGSFTTVNGNVTRLGAAAFDATSGVATSWAPNLSDSVSSIGISDSGIYLGGNFTVSGAVVRHHLAAINPATGQLTAWNPNVNETVASLALSPDGDTLYAGGSFTLVNGGTSRNYLAAFDVATASVTSWDPNLDSNPDAIMPSSDGNTIYIAGEFTSVNGSTPRFYLAALDASTALATSWDPNLDGPVYGAALSPDGNTVYVAGSFTSVNGGTARGGIAAFPVSTSTVLSIQPDTNGSASDVALSADGSTLYVGGYFTTVNGGVTPRNNLAAFNTATGLATSFDPNLNDGLDTIFLSGSTLYVTGPFTHVNQASGNVSRSYAAAFDVATASTTDWEFNSPSLDGNNFYVNVLAASADFLYAGGSMNSNLVRFAVTGSVAPTTPTNFSGWPVGSSQLSLSWTGSDPSYLVTNVTDNTTTSVASTFANFSGLDCFKTYQFNVRGVAADASESSVTSNVSVRTGQCGGGGASSPSGDGAASYQSPIVVATSTNNTAIAPPQGVPSQYHFVRLLKLGMRGRDVKELQLYLNSHGFIIAQNGPGAPGHETEYFGALTRRAVMYFQEAKADVILRPLGLSRGTGVVGPATVAAMY